MGAGGVGSGAYGARTGGGGAGVGGLARRARRHRVGEVLGPTPLRTGREEGPNGRAWVRPCRQFPCAAVENGCATYVEHRRGHGGRIAVVPPISCDF